MSQELIKPGPLSPQAIVDAATEKAKILKQLVSQAHLTVKIGASQHLKFEAWQTLGRFDRVTAAVGWSRPLHNRANDIIGYEARAEAFQDGAMISAAEAQCTIDEANWKNKELWQLRSMAQTRACAKALRNVLAWIVVLAGYETTPAEEMTSASPSYKPNWRKFRQELKDLGVPEEKVKTYLGVASIKDDWFGRQHKTLDEAIEVIKAAITPKSPPEEAQSDHQGEIPGMSE